MRAYYFDNAPGDQRLPHDSGREVPLETLAALGVLYWRIPVDTPGGWEPKINAIADERRYSSRDVVTANKDAFGPAFEEKMDMFFRECVGFGLDIAPQRVASADGALTGMQAYP